MEDPVEEYSDNEATDAQPQEGEAEEQRDLHAPADAPEDDVAVEGAPAEDPVMELISADHTLCFEDTLPPPARPATRGLPAVVPAFGGVEEARAPAAAAPPAAVHEGHAPPDHGEDSDGGEVDVTPGEAPLRDEPWMWLPERERELWERLRPRSLRREAAQLRALKLPAASVQRLMRLHPHLSMKSVEAVELINFATILMMQAVAKNAVREKGPGRTRVQFSDIRKACLGVRELQFLSPLESTLDASALVMRAVEVVEVAEPVEQPKRASAAPAQGAGRRAGPRPGFAAFAKAFANAAVPFQVVEEEAPEVAEEEAPDNAQDAGPEAHESESAGELTPNPEDRVPAAAGVKRCAPASTKKAPSKVPRHTTGERGQKVAAAGGGQRGGPGGGGGIAMFFRRAEAAA